MFEPKRVYSVNDIQVAISSDGYEKVSDQAQDRYFILVKGNTMFYFELISDTEVKCVSMRNDIRRDDI